MWDDDLRVSLNGLLAFGTAYRPTAFATPEHKNETK